MSNTLCIDIGNTCIHYGALNEDKVLFDARIAIPNNSSSTTEYEQILDKIQAQQILFESVSFCSVVPECAASLSKLLEDNRLAKTQLLGENTGIWGLKLTGNQKLGADCLANLIAVKAHYQSPAIVIDAGTAVTVDSLDKNGNLTGNIIAPGLRLYTEFLHKKTALLPKISLHADNLPPLADQTIIEAMETGCHIGYQGMVEALINQALLSFPKNSNVNIYATGGHIDFLRKMPFNITFDPYLTLKGLQVAQKCN